MSNFKVEFKLKQHTPIIHFQSDQSGATLRATELKPKLDRFLLQIVPDLSYRENANGDKSLEYKVKIEQDRSTRIEIPERDPLFFGNMKPKDKTDEEWNKLKKRFKLSDKFLTIEFFTFNTNLKKAIEEHFEQFLAQTNFGTRQSKGFGSFYLVDKETKKPKDLDTKLITHKVYSFPSKKWKDDIKLLYQFLRQGVNLPNREGTRFYSKPAIFSFAKSQKWEWDKKAIKEAYFSSVMKKHKQEHKGNDVVEFTSDKQYLLRDLFGLSSSQKWGKDYHGVSIEKEDTNKDPKEHKPVIERFKSPITFKVVNNYVYFWADKSVERMLNQRFLIKAGRGNDTLELPTPPHFDFEEFFDFTFSIDLASHIDQKYHNQPEYATLRRIFKAIKGNQ
jgi:hypothetical protein